LDSVGQIGGPGGNNCRVFVVDDEEILRVSLVQALSTRYSEVVAFSTVAELLEAVEQDPPSVVLTDLRMPGASGLDVLDWMAKNAAGVPVIVMTGYDDGESRRAVELRGAAGFIAKPFGSLEAVAQLIDASVSSHTH